MDDSKKIIEVAIVKLHEKLRDLDLERLNISAYNKKYLKKYLTEYDFLMCQYQQLLEKAVKKLKKPITKSCFIDYGGGCGMLSYLAKEIGFKEVIYNDIYKVSVNDTKVIAKQLGSAIDNFILGDVEVLVTYILEQKRKPDLICSFDVLEHIYNLEEWFRSIANIPHPFSLVFMTAANPKNPFVSNRLKKLHKKVEFAGVQQGEGWKEIDLSTSYFYERKKIIKEYCKGLTSIEVRQLAYTTRGLRKDDILELVDKYNEGSIIDYEINHPSNTCDPYTGNWAEHLIDLEQLQRFLEQLKLKTVFTNSYYGYSKNKLFNLPKYVLNILIRLSGKNNLVLSPTYTLEVQKTKYA